MANKGVFWNGRFYITPQAVSRIDTSDLTPVALGAPGSLAILGTMFGLITPGKSTLIGDPTTAQALLNPACVDALEGVKRAFNPSPVEPGVSQLFLVPVNVATPSTLTDAALVYTSYMTGIPANQVKRKVEAGTLIGKKITVSFQSITEVFDNLGKSSLSILYTGAGSACALTITPTLAGHSLSTVCTGAAGDNLDLDLATFATIQALCDAISATGKYTAIAMTPSPTADLSMGLDSVTGQDIKTSAYTCKSDLQACVEGINGKSAYITVASVADVGAPPANVNWTYLAGSGNGTTTTTDWQNALNLLKTMKVGLVVGLTSDPAIQSMIDAHAAYMSGPDGKSERHQIAGGPLQSWVGETARATAVAALVTQQANLNSGRTLIAGLGAVTYDANGDSTLFPAYLTACMYAGIAAGNKPSNPITNKTLRCTGLEVELRPEEITTLLQAGVAVPVPDNDNGGYVISRQVTTYNQSDDLYQLELSVGRGADYIASQVRQRHKAVAVGQGGLLQMGTTLVNVTNAVLKAAKTNGDIADYDPKKTTLRAVGTAWYVDYSATPVVPINFVFGTMHLAPTNFTIGL